MDIDSKSLFKYASMVPISGKVKYWGHIIRTMFRSYNNGIGFTMVQLPVRNMCSVLDVKDLAVYTVVHSRLLEGRSGFHILSRVCGFGCCDHNAAL